MHRGARFSNKVVIVTGAASGIGLATAQAFLEEGARVAATDIDAGVDRWRGSLGGSEEARIALVHDVTSEAAWEAVVEQTLARFGRLDVLVNNAGISASSPVVDMTLEQWRRVMAVNLDGVFLGTKHAVRALRRHGEGGAIVNVASVAALAGNPGTSVYAASKGGVRSFTKAVAIECAAEGIRVNAVFPAAVKTPIWERSEWWPGFAASVGGDEAAWKTLSDNSPMGRIAEPGEVAQAILYLASDDARFATGAELVLDGGYTSR